MNSNSVDIKKQNGSALWLLGLHSETLRFEKTAAGIEAKLPSRSTRTLPQLDPGLTFERHP
ncbi:hypothetical protein CHH53_11540 [Terribacillus sp. 7520-G]|nr:hypothetical protein CHH53_11540 [Terribacillus sp. 7520-G]